ncbi:peptidoglycan-binding domain-containing protein [Chenggangzhangella methanolivorans]|uniref:peptidoglycan-binding domain-containing protein n=1 Tax=Chenggangzhangella methanolivorans TaxID=1437009 RepID=UPI0021BD89EA|nr:peptidoglycan-binding domain-containing protein [Chenggangzhangella methanolivorans]
MRRPRPISRPASPARRRSRKATPRFVRSEATSSRSSSAITCADGWLPEDEVDGKLGGDTRRATRKAQEKLGLPADGYPTVELLQALNASRG